MTTKQHIFIAETPLTGPVTERLIRGERAAHVEAHLRADLIKVRRATPDDVARLVGAGTKIEGIEQAVDTRQAALPIEPPAAVAKAA